MKFNYKKYIKTDIWADKIFEAKTHEERAKIFHQWLDVTVIKYESASEVKLSNFVVDWKWVSGSYDLFIDNQKLEDRFKFVVEGCGRVSIRYPIYHSPFGLPVSYSSFSLSSSIEKMVNEALERTFPKFKPFGRDQVSGLNINMQTDFLDRVDPNEQYKAKVLVTKEYSITVSDNIL